MTVLTWKKFCFVLVWFHLVLLVVEWEIEGRLLSQVLHFLVNTPFVSVDCHPLSLQKASWVFPNCVVCKCVGELR